MIIMIIIVSRTALHLAAVQGDTRILDLLQEADGKESSSIKDNDGNTVLHKVRCLNRELSLIP